MKKEVFLPVKTDTVSIYILTEPDGETVRYIGQTFSPPARLRSHIAESTNWRFCTSAKHEWIAQLSKAKQSPRMFVIEIVPADKALAKEQEWISRYKEQGANVLNNKQGTGWRMDNLSYWGKAGPSAPVSPYTAPVQQSAWLLPPRTLVPPRNK